MSTIIDIGKLTEDPELLRKVTLIGPPAAGRPMWVLSAGSPYFGRENAREQSATNNLPAGTTADHVHPLRVLTAEKSSLGGKKLMPPRLASVHLVVGAENDQYRRPKPEDDSLARHADRLQLNWAPNKQVVVNALYGKTLRTITEGADQSDGEAPFVHVTADLLGDVLSKFGQSGDDHDGDGIPAPPMRLVAGRIGLYVDPDEGDMKWLKRLGIVANGANKLDWRTWPRIWLVPDGIEFEAKLEFPGRPTVSPPLLGTVLMHPAPGLNGAMGFRLRLISATNENEWKLAWGNIVPESGNAGEELLGLKFAGRRTGKLPEFSWAVIVDSGGYPTGVKRTSVDVAARDCEIALVSPPVLGAIDSVASLRLASVTAREVPVQIDSHQEKVVEFTFSVPPVAATSDINLRCGCTPDTFTIKAVDPEEPVILDFELARLADDLRNAYGIEAPPAVSVQRDAGLPFGKEFGRPLIPAFVALDNGWLQLPIPNLGPLDTSSDQMLSTAQHPAPPNVLNGFLRVRHAGLGPEVQSGFTPDATPARGTGAPWALTVEQAAGVDGNVWLRPGGASGAAKLLKAELTLRSTVLSTRGMLWVSTDRPDAQEALPRLGAGPGSFIDVVMQSPEPGERSAIEARFDGLAIIVPRNVSAGPPLLGWKSMALNFLKTNKRWADEVLKPEEARRALASTGKCIDGNFPDSVLEGEMPRPWPSVAWLRHPVIPLAATMPMTRAASGSSRPLESRDLFPFALLSSDTEAEQKPWMPLAILMKIPDSPLLELASVEGEVFGLQPVKSWPLAGGDAIKAVEAATDRGIGFASVGVPGVELRASIDKADEEKASEEGKPGLQAALRYDLPLLDEAFATAALPPHDDPAAVFEPSSDSVATALDWTLLADFWRAQERKHQNCRVVDSYFSRFEPVDAVNGVNVTTLVRGLTWVTTLQVETYAKKPPSDLPYGTLTINGDGGASGNDALVGYGGWFTPNLDLKTLTPATAANVDTVEVLGFSPGTFHVDGIDLDNNMNGAKAPSVVDGIISRVVSYHKAGDMAHRLVSLLAPLNVRIDMSQSQVDLQFWFKDVLFVGDEAVLAAQHAPVNFDALDDDALLAANGFEWRLAPVDSDLARAALKLGRSEIPLSGFRLEPLRLMKLGLKANKVASAEILCRLSLDPRNDAANLIVITLAPDASNARLEATFALADESAHLRFGFTINDTVLSPVDESIQRNVLATAKFKTQNAPFCLQGVTFQIEVAGMMVGLGVPEFLLLPDSSSHSAAVQISQSNSEPSSTGLSRLRIEKAVVKAGYKLELVGETQVLRDQPPILDWSAFIELYPQGEYTEPTFPAVTWALGMYKTLTLLGAATKPSDMPCKEANGALSTSINAGEYIRGKVRIASVAAAFVVRLGHQTVMDVTDGTVPLAAGHCEGVVTQESADHFTGPDDPFGPGISIRGGRLEWSVSTGDSDIWLGKADVSATITAYSDIRWPSLDSTPQPVPLPDPGHPGAGTGHLNRTGRVIVRAGTMDAATHCVSWILAGHPLPLGLAAAIFRTDSLEIWATPAVARHSLTRGKQVLSWTGIESIAIGRLAGLVPKVPSDLADDVMTYASRYAHPIAKGEYGSEPDPGMKVAGFGAIATVLQGTLGLDFRTMFWNAAPENKIIFAGGFLGMLKLDEGTTNGPLLRLPVLAGSGMTIGQSDIGANGIELAWSDGPAARAVALTRPTAPSPASASFESVASALLAGSLPPSDRGSANTQSVAGSLLVEQSFDNRPSRDGPSLERTPFFLAAAVSVAAVLDAAQKAQPAPGARVLSLSLVSGTLQRDGNTVALAASVSMRDAKPVAAPQPSSATLYVLGQKVSYADWSGARPAESMGSMMPFLRALAPTRDPDPVGFLLAFRGGAQGATYAGGVIESLALDRRLAPNTVPASFTDGRRGALAAPVAAGAMRWLAPPSEGPASPIRDALALSAAATGQWGGSGLAGLTRRMTLPAHAARAWDVAGEQAGPSNLVWLSQTQAPVYLPLLVTQLRGTPIGWLQTAPPLVRLPVDADVTAAIVDSLQKGENPNSSARNVQPFMPGQMAIGSVGERAGIMTLRRSRLLTRLDSAAADGISAYDAVNSRFGAPAQAGSSWARKLRTPRPGPLPANLGDPTRDRRVQASAVRPLAAASAVLGSSDIVLGLKGRFGKFKFDGWSIQVVACPESASVVSERWDGALRMVCRVDVRRSGNGDEGTSVTPVQFLRMALLLTDCNSSARLKIGDEVVVYRRFTVENNPPPEWIDGTASPGSFPMGWRVLSADISLVFDPRAIAVEVSGRAPFEPIARALTSTVPTPRIEVQWTVQPTSHRKEVLASPKPEQSELFGPKPVGFRTLIAGGGERAPLTLRMPLYPVVQARGALPLTPATLVFGDPAYDRDLASPPVSARKPVSVIAPGELDHRGDLRMTLYADRGRVNRRGVVTLMLDVAYERRMDELAQEAAEEQGAGPGGDLMYATDPKEVATMTLKVLATNGTKRDLEYANAKSANELWLALGTVYELPLAMLVETDGQPASLLPGDVLLVGVTLRGLRPSVPPSASPPTSVEVKLWNTGKQSADEVAIPLTPEVNCTLTLTLTDESVVEPPPALYLALQRTRNAKGNWRLAVPLHAQSPLPRRVDLMDPARGFRSGMMKRHADFVWYMTCPKSQLGDHSLTVLKSDRNGQGYWPSTSSEFLTPEDFDSARKSSLRQTCNELEVAWLSGEQNDHT
ncbi:MAG: hypothetical protein CFE43_21175 [Burkholderiales bacterium PBB3]|nr:MAG: hypothetical protein CFE43_21175 [Burkholderiales bacterium PBB3]